MTMKQLGDMAGPSSDPTTNTKLPTHRYCYTVKAMNPGMKRDYDIHKLKANKFESVEELRDYLLGALPCGFTQLGYIEPGHGLKGKTQWLVEDDDLVEMYTKCQKSSILLWCLKEGQPSKSLPKKGTSVEDTAFTPATKKQTASNHCAKIITEVEDVVKQLKEKHGSLYTVEQLNCWAHMYQSQKHGSLDFLPNLPYFRGTKHQRSTSSKDNSAGTASQNSSRPGMSPTKRVTLRTECMKQLELWHSLLEKGGISKETYDDMQRTILEDIKENF